MTAEPYDLRALQAPLKERYRDDPASALITLSASATSGALPTSVTIEAGHATFEVQAHAGTGGPGTADCPGDILLASLAACAQITCQMVAESARIPLRSVTVRAEGDMDLQGTLGLNPRVPVGFGKIRLYFDLDAPDATSRQLAVLQRSTDQYCTVLQTLFVPPQVEAYWTQPEAALE